MDALIGVGGVFLGWLLALATEELKRRREGRAAAALVWAELFKNEQRLEQLATLKSDVPVDGAVRRTAWEAFGVALLSVADKDTHYALIEAYHGAETAESTSTFLRTAVDEERDAIALLDDRLRRAGEVGNTQEAESVSADILRRTRNLEFFEKQRDDYCDSIKQDSLPDVSKARERVEGILR